MESFEEKLKNSYKKYGGYFLDDKNKQIIKYGKFVVLNHKGKLYIEFGDVIEHFELLYKILTDLNIFNENAPIQLIDKNVYSGEFGYYETDYNDGYLKRDKGFYLSVFGAYHKNIIDYILKNIKSLKNIINIKDSNIKILLYSDIGKEVEVPYTEYDFKNTENINKYFLNIRKFFKDNPEIAKNINIDKLYPDLNYSDKLQLQREFQKFLNKDKKTIDVESKHLKTRYKFTESVKYVLSYKEFLLKS